MSDAFRSAAQAYASGNRVAPDQRRLEADALLKAALLLEDARSAGYPTGGAALDDAVLNNRKLWTVFAAEAADGADRLPRDLRTNIANIAVFVFRRSFELMAVPAPEKVDALIEINRTIAAGLLARPAAALATASPSAGVQPAA